MSSRFCRATTIILLIFSEMSDAHLWRQRDGHNDTAAVRSHRPSLSHPNQRTYETDSHAIHYYMTYACEREKLRLACDTGYTILIVRANYGRHSTTLCDRSPKIQNTFCNGLFLHAKKVLSKVCTGVNKCEVPVISQLFGEPCPKVYKYLEVYYGCVKDYERLNDEETET